MIPELRCAFSQAVFMAALAIFSFVLGQFYSVTVNIKPITDALMLTYNTCVSLTGGM